MSKETQNTHEEYALNVRRISNGDFLYQIDCYQTYEEAAEAEKEPLDNPDKEYYDIVYIEYDENGNEIGSYSVI